MLSESMKGEVIDERFRKGVFPVVLGQVLASGSGACWIPKSKSRLTMCNIDSMQDEVEHTSDKSGHGRE